MRSAIYPLYQQIALEDNFCQQTAKAILHNVSELFEGYRGLTIDVEKMQRDENIRLFTDASEEPDASVLGGVLVTKNALLHFSHTFDPKALAAIKKRHNKKKIIASLELAAVLVAASTFRSELAGIMTPAYIDNCASIFAACKGTSKDLVLRLAAQALYAETASSSTSLLPRWVPTNYNVADGATRPEYHKRLLRVLEKYGSKTNKTIIQTHPTLQVLNSLVAKILSVQPMTKENK